MRILIALCAMLFVTPAFAEDRGFGFTFDIVIAGVVCEGEICKKDGAPSPPEPLVHALLVQKLACSGPAVDAGLMTNDAVLEINGIRILGLRVSAFSALIEEALKSSSVRFLIGRASHALAAPTTHTVVLTPRSHENDFLCGGGEEL